MENKSEELVTVTSIDYSIATSSEYKQILKEMPTVIDKAKRLLSTPANETLDEEEFTRTQRELEQYNRYYKDIEASKKKIRKHFDNEKKKVMDMYNEQLEKAGYEELIECVNAIKNRKKMIEENRKRKHWDEIKEHFNHLLNTTYPEIKEKMPDINFENFQANNDKLVKGAKTFKVNDKILNTVSEYLDRVNKNLKSILTMESIYEEKLLKDYAQVQDLSEIMMLEKRYKKEEQRQQELRAKRLEEQQRKIEKENKKREQVAKLKKEKAQKQCFEHIEKLNKVYSKVNNAVMEYSDGITDDDAKRVLNDILNIIKD